MNFPPRQSVCLCSAITWHVLSSRFTLHTFNSSLSSAVKGVHYLLHRDWIWTLHRPLAQTLNALLFLEVQRSKSDRVTLDRNPRKQWKDIFCRRTLANIKYLFTCSSCCPRPSLVTSTQLALTSTRKFDSKCEVAWSSEYLASSLSSPAITRSDPRRGSGSLSFRSEVLEVSLPAFWSLRKVFAPDTASSHVVCPPDQTRRRTNARHSQCCRR